MAQVVFTSDALEFDTREIRNTSNTYQHSIMFLNIFGYIIVICKGM